jgi:hypothetical protein
MDLQRQEIYQVGIMYTPREFGRVDVGNFVIVVAGPNFSHPDEFIVTFEAVSQPQDQQP